MQMRKKGTAPPSKPLVSRRTPEAPTIVIKRASEIDNPRAFLFYGRGGTGKTTLSASFPGPRLLLDINDRGTDSISDTDTDVIEVHEWSAIEAVYWDIKDNPERYSSYKTLVIDTVTMMQSLCIEEVLRKKKKDVSKAGDWGTMTKREWGDVSQLMKSWIVNYRDLPITVVFLAQDRVSKDGDEDEEVSDEAMMPEIGPSLSPAVAKTLVAAVYAVGNTFIRRKVTTKEVNGKKVHREQLQYCLRIGPHPICLTKIRKPKSIEVPSVIVDPTYDDILSIIKGD